MNDQSLSGRIFRWSIVWCALMLAVYTALYTVSYHARSLQSYKRVLQLEMATLVGQGIDKLAVASDTNNWERYVAVTNSAIRLSNDQGNVLFQTASSIFTPDRINQVIHNLPPQVPYAADNSTLTWSRPYNWRDASGEHHVMAATRDVRFVSGEHGTLTVMSLSDSLTNDTVDTLFLMLVIDGVVLVLFGFGMRWLTVRGLRPLHKLIESIQAVEWKQSERIHLTALPREVASLQQSVNQLLDRIDQGIGEQNRFIADASHELRTPLAIIAGHANLLRRWGHHNERVWEPAVRNIVSEVERLQKLVNQLLSMAKVEEAPSAFVGGLKAADVRELFDNLHQDADVLRPDLNFQTRVHLTSKSRASMDRDDLRQVLIGLLDNAMRHTPEGGRIELTAHGDEGMVRFTVSDSGEGIAPDVLPHVFDRFYRAQSLRGRGKGSGLGLSICRQIIESYHGKVFVRSQLGMGTTVVILIPMNEPRSGPPSTESIEPQHDVNSHPRVPPEKGYESNATEGHS